MPVDTAAGRALENAITLLSEQAMGIRDTYYNDHGRWRNYRQREEWIYTMMTIVRLRQIADGQPVYPFSAQDTIHIDYTRVWPGRATKE